jgi:O-antigen biosynthesis protein
LRFAKPSISQSKARVTKLQFTAFSNKPDVSIVIPVYNKVEYTINCLDSITKNTSGEYEVIVVDDCSSDDTSRILPKIKNLRFVRNKINSGFIDSCNHGAEISRGKHILFLNNDTLVTRNWLPSLLNVMTRENVGAAGSKLIYPDGKLQEAGGIIWNDGSGCNYGRGDNIEKPEYNYVKEVDYCSGACLVVKRELFEKIGGFDKRFKPGYYEDTDLCFALRNIGYKIIYQPMSQIIHFEGITCGTDISSGVKSYQEVNKRKFIEKWYTSLQKYHYNPDPENLPSARDRRSGKRILVIDHYVPTYDKDSGSLRMFNILKILSELGNKVTFIGDNLIRTEPYNQELQQTCVEVIYAPYEFSVKEYVKKNGKFFDFVLLSRPHIAIKYIDLVREVCVKAKIIYDTVDLVFLRESRRADLENNPAVAEQAATSKIMELYLAKISDITFVVSPVEREILLKENASLNIEVVSNIHDVRKPQKIFSERKDLLFVGGFDHPPNVDAAKYFVEKIFPLVKQKIPDIQFFIVGSNPPKEVLSLHSTDIIVTGYVKDLTPYFDDCRVFVAPLRYGAGIKGKINQSMSYGLPVVATTLGAEGIGLVDGVDALIADVPEQYAEKVIRAYQDEGLWNKLSGNSLNTVINQFSSDIAKKTLKKLLCNDSNQKS